MSLTPPPSRAPSPPGGEQSPRLPDRASWVGFIEGLLILYKSYSRKPVIDRLSGQEEAEIDSYLAAGVDINEACIKNLSRKIPPLFMAISNRCPPLVNALLERGARTSVMTMGLGANPSPSMRENALALSLLAHHGDNPHSTAILNAILTTPGPLSPAEINAPHSIWQETPLAVCVRTRNAWVRDIIMANGADARCLHRDDRTLLHALITSESEPEDKLKKDTAWMHWILSQGVPIDALDINGNTALDLARIYRGVDDPFVALLARAHLDHLTAPPPRAVNAPSRRI